MIFYLTYNDLPSGIYSSQVIDVVKFYTSELKVNIKLVSLISIRSFFVNRRKIKNELPGAIVLPMFPGVHRWKYNSFLLNILFALKKPSLVIGRSVLATQLALNTKTKKIVYDGRGAIAAEWKEYKVVTNKNLLAEIKELEKNVILNSNYRISVSVQLVDHWREEYNYNDDKHVIIPCTLNKLFENINITESAILSARLNLKLEPNNVVFAYSGSLAGWQSFALLYEFIKPILSSSPLCKLLFLSEKDENLIKLEKEFPGKIICKKVTPQQVPAYLLSADYGLLIREQSITNKVASPVKFAEYLACGLKVLISENLGDYSEFVKKNTCGYNFKEFKNESPIVVPVRFDEKQAINQLALNNFTKKRYLKLYEQLISA